MRERGVSPGDLWPLSDAPDLRKRFHELVQEERSMRLCRVWRFTRILTLGVSVTMTRFIARGSPNGASKKIVWRSSLSAGRPSPEGMTESGRSCNMWSVWVRFRPRRGRHKLLYHRKLTERPNRRTSPKWRQKMHVKRLEGVHEVIKLTSRRLRQRNKWPSPIFSKRRRRLIKPKTVVEVQVA